MTDNLVENNQEQIPIENSPRLSNIFHHEGNFKDGTTIVKGSNYGEETTLTVDRATTDILRDKLYPMVQNTEASLPQQEFFPNGLSRHQAAEVVSVANLIYRFNGGVPDSASTSRNTLVYVENEDGEKAATLADFENRKALTCAESSVLTQQLLSPTQDMIYVSGAADLDGLGKFEMHTFNLIKPDDPQFAMAVLDIANPILVRQPTGSIAAKVYCAPLSTDQLDVFRDGKTVTIDYGGEQRAYQFGLGTSGFRAIW